MNRVELDTQLTKEEVERAIRLLLKERERAKLRAQRVRAKAREGAPPKPVKEPKERKERTPKERKEPKPRKSRAGVKPAKSYYVPTGRPRGRPRKVLPVPEPPAPENLEEAGKSPVGGN